MVLAIEWKKVEQAREMIAISVFTGEESEVPAMKKDRVNAYNETGATASDALGNLDPISEPAPLVRAKSPYIIPMEVESRFKLRAAGWKRICDDHPAISVIEAIAIALIAVFCRMEASVDVFVKEGVCCELSLSSGSDIAMSRAGMARMAVIRKGSSGRVL